MTSFLRSTASVARVFRQSSVPLRVSSQPIRLAHSSYGDSQSGHQKSDAPNPQAHQEHPGPEAPADQGAGKSASSSSSSSSSPESTTQGVASTPSKSSSEKSASDKSAEKKTSSGAKPALFDPKDEPNTDDPEVKKHNEEMRQRADQTPNQVK